MLLTPELQHLAFWLFVLLALIIAPQAIIWHRQRREVGR